MPVFFRKAAVFTLLAAILAASVVLLWASSARAAASGSPIASLPYRLDYDGWYTVSAMVNGSGPYDFIIDTGASITVVFANLAAVTPLEPADKTRRLLGMAGSARLPAYWIDRIELGDASADRLMTVVVDDWSGDRRTPQGVLGLDFLSNYVVHVDQRAGLFHLYPAGAEVPAVTRKWGRIALKPETFGIEDGGVLYVLEPWVSGRQMPFALDLGASGTVINSAALRHLLGGKGWQIDLNRSASRLARIEDIFDNAEKGRPVRIDSMSIGRARWRNMLWVVRDISIFDELGVNDQPFGLFGAENFENRDFVIDFGRGELMVSKPRKPAAQ